MKVTVLEVPFAVVRHTFTCPAGNCGTITFVRLSDQDVTTAVVEPKQTWLWLPCVRKWCPWMLISVPGRAWSETSALIRGAAVSLIMKSFAFDCPIELVTMTLTVPVPRSGTSTLIVSSLHSVTGAE